ncbi:MAG: hypothetical protein FWE12_06715 [Oscillospiraceae bacterium]|nr:hypothetical protein [Oscillospiraceae bacterium]
MMKELFGEYTVDYNSTKVGVLTVSQSGLMARFACQCTVATAEILRLAVLSGDRYIPLGVLLPSGDKLHFIKHYSKLDLRIKGLSSIDGCRLITGRDTLLIPPVERPVPEPEPIPEATPNEPESVPKPTPEPGLILPVEDGIPDVPPLVTAPEPNPIQEPDWLPADPNSNQPILYTHTARITVDAAPVADEDLIGFEPYLVEDLTGTDLSPVTDLIAPESEPVFVPWTPHPDPGLLFLDPDLIASCAQITGAMTRPCGNDCIALAVPFEAGKPFPLLPVFCLGAAEEIGGGPFLVFQIKNGILVKE